MPLACSLIYKFHPFFLNLGKSLYDPPTYISRVNYMHHLLNYTSGGYLDFFLESMDQIAGACGTVLKYLNCSSCGTLKHCNMCFYGAEIITYRRHPPLGQRTRQDMCDH